jgi:hypothetical protein
MVVLFTSTYTISAYSSNNCECDFLLVVRFQSFLSTSNYLPSYRLVGWFMVFNTTFNTISVILWWSVLLVEETREFGENHQSVPIAAIIVSVISFLW